MAYDAMRGMTVLFGGVDVAGDNGDTWGLRVSCYPNCDGSTANPILNVNDFVCFGNRFAEGSPYANCDGSTAPPILNVSDYICFLNAFAAGCP
ncbi:MAG: GC-type dockerin domain-anchored protein [Phycisphaerales bacterium]